MTDLEGEDEVEYRTKTGRILTDSDIEKLAAEAEQGYDDPPIIFTDVTIQESGVIPLPFGIDLNAMTDPEAKTCTYTMTSFAMTEPEARDNLNNFLELLIKTITPQT